MVAIGGCDYCGEYCSSLAVYGPYELASGWVPTSSRKRHVDLVERRIECAERDGYDWSVGTHRGPLHDQRGRKLTTCRHCSSRSWMDEGSWDTSLDHSECPDCWARIAGGAVLQKRRRAVVAPFETPTRESTGDDGPTALGDRARVQAAFDAYLARRLPIRWVPSPLAVVEALRSAPGFVQADNDPWSLWAADQAIRDRLANAPLPEGESLPEPGASVVPILAATIARRLLAANRESTMLIAAILADAGQFDDRVGALQALAHRGQPIAGDAALIGLLTELHAAAGPVVVLPNEIIVSERPLVLSLDDGGRLHGESGPAIAYGDGLVVYAWHGVVVPAWVIETPDRIDPGTIDKEPNIEIRRVMVERFGVVRLILEGGATLVHEDAFGRLWRKPLGDPGEIGRSSSRPGTEAMRRDEPIVIVEVENSTLERDGSKRRYFLRVPPTVRTAREGVAWTFGMAGTDYQPLSES